MIARRPVADATPAEAARLVRQAAELAVEISGAEARSLLQLRDLLVRWNRAFNLVSRRDAGRLIPRHLLDSLSVAPWLTGTRVLDLGTGAGLPGLPLAIVREDVHFTLIDLNERRIRFVSRAVRTLGLGNVSPRAGDVRALPADDVFDTVVCRAVADVGTVWSLAAARLRPAGRLILMSRGQAPQSSERDPAKVPDGARLISRHQVRIPELPRPHELVVLEHGAASGGGPA